MGWKPEHCQAASDCYDKTLSLGRKRTYLGSKFQKFQSMPSLFLSLSLAMGLGWHSKPQWERVAEKT